MWENSLPAQDFQLFKEALIEENLEIQVAIIKRFESLAKALGEKITREELLPFVELHFIELHDEILFHLAVQLKSFIPLVGGVEHCQIVFDILSKLCITDENIVREKAVESLIWIQEDLNGQEVERYIFPVIIRLIKDDWFTSKCSAVMVFSHIYSKLSNDRKSELRNNFKMLIQDDSPMVRKAASMACVKMCDVVEDGSLKSEFVPIFKDIAQDPMDSVRAGTIEIALALIKRLGSECLEEVIFKIIEEASGDSVYAVRRSACMVVPILTKRFGIKWAAEHLVPFFAVFAMDSRYLYRFVALFGISEMVISSLCPKPINILDGFKCFIEQTDHVRYFQALRTLVKVVQTNHLVQLKMKESNFDSMLSLRNKLDYLPHSDLKMYSEQSSDEIPRVNIYFIEENDLQNNHWPYVQGILYLIYNKFLPIIEKLNNDYTENVQLKAISALNEIAEFLQKLEEEEKQEWVQRSIQSLSNEEISVIIEEVHLELKNVQFENNVDLLDEIK
ncbi:serine/threonine-protein phosphatase 2A 65 kDa regulatory subunit A beta isoform-like isoform X3 [Anthonomus grandis grandis]|uniref:serine/threonine-protein phosphatase 2A 65 kDa regulatory subunit A beta isoform-like isoform X3 n=1 Tax=Anthonomus grandis grandis TaxID=2921223 RepID=UPI0021651A17|nr:serine/threonine-protein phosphatase 2A 65 kDa regulatory subunit A beta isoform-like isoform X3 [Anthonomus grandis grandis]